MMSNITIMINDESKQQKCRERNRIHARNTRERKKNQLEMIQLRIQALQSEKKKLSNFVADASVAEILITLAENTPTTQMETFESIRSTDHNSTDFMSSMDSDDLDTDAETSCLKKEDVPHTLEDVDTIRRERNRLHAQMTRLRKKKMLHRLESILRTLECEVTELRKKEQAIRMRKLTPTTNENVNNIPFCYQSQDAVHMDKRIKLSNGPPLSMYFHHPSQYSPGMTYMSPANASTMYPSQMSGMTNGHNAYFPFFPRPIVADSRMATNGYYMSPYMNMGGGQMYEQLQQQLPQQQQQPLKMHRAVPQVHIQPNVSPRDKTIQSSSKNDEFKNERSLEIKIENKISIH